MSRKTKVQPVTQDESESTKHRPRGSYKRLLQRAEQAREEQERLIRRAMEAKADALIANDPEMKRLDKQEKDLRNQLWRDRIQVPRVRKQAERLLRDGKELIAESERGEVRIKQAEEQLEAVISAKNQIRDRKVDELLNEAT